MADLRFTKMVASGNDFIVIDNRESQIKKTSRSAQELALELCERRQSIGADGLLIIEGSKSADFRMRIVNPDGSEVSMCGNGIRCVALYAVENTIAGKDFKIETGAGTIEAEVVGLNVKTMLTDPKDLNLNLDLKIGKRKVKSSYIDTGVPHVVSFVKDVDKLDVEKEGSAIRYHENFRPDGTNADCVQVIDSKNIKVRTYERGVEAETLACGTGAVASAVIASLVKGLRPHIDVLTKSGEVLRVYFECDGKKVNSVYLEGEARAVYEGRLSYV